MNKIVILAFTLTFFLSACLFSLPFPVGQTAAPTVNVRATEDVLSLTLAAQTLNALPTPTLVVAIDTIEPTLTPTGPATATDVSSETATPESGLTATSTATIAVTGTATLPGQANPTATITLHPRFFGTLPPAIPYGQVTLVNRAKADVYVSLQCITIDGYKTIIEYPVFGRLNVSAPAGRYIYVAWVGGRQFDGSFHLDKGEELSIFFNKEKVTFK